MTSSSTDSNLDSSLDSTAILPQWTRLAEESLEAGHVPAIVLGTGFIAPDALPGLLTLATLDESHTGLANPATLVGGDASLWFLALIQRCRLAHTLPGGPVSQRIQSIQRRVPPALFTGADMATHSAGLTLAAQTLVADRLGPVSPAQGNPISPGLAWNLLPMQRAGAINRWDWLPFEAGTAASSSSSTSSAMPAENAEPPPHAPIATATAYIGLFLALGLILAALLL